MRDRSGRVIEFLQFCTMAVMWIFAASITLWVLQLARVAYSLKDAITASVGISMVAIPVFWTLAAILTYTFFGLRRTRPPRAASASHDPSSGAVGETVDPVGSNRE